MFRSLYSVYCLCVNVCCTAVTGCQPNVCCTAATGCQPNVCCTAATGCQPNCGYIYRVIHKSFRDFRPLRYRSRDGHAEWEHVNRGRDTASFCPTLQVLDMYTLGDATDVKFWQIPRHRPLTYSLSTPRFVTTASLAVKPASTPRRLVQKIIGEILCLLICCFLPCLSSLLRSSEIPEGLINNPVYVYIYIYIYIYKHIYHSSNEVTVRGSIQNIPDWCRHLYRSCDCAKHR
jgi:hypothetical protein